MAEELRPGLVGEAELVCGPEHAASRFGADGIEVLATPIMVGLMEHAAIMAADRALPAGSQTVGTSMNFKHSAATPLGVRVRARAELTEVDGRRLVFRIEAFDPWEAIGSAEHERFVIRRDRFLERVAEKASRPPAG
ncbi:MAG TPA: thioesterase family protein [Dehalococcoidia bacterium]|nr:thioesterase family protein [Dehalococcoidia bacterium]